MSNIQEYLIWIMGWLDFNISYNKTLWKVKKEVEKKKATEKQDMSYKRKGIIITHYCIFRLGTFSLNDDET